MPKADKAYKNLDFLNSPEARTVRILSEYMEPRRRFRREGVRHTIVVFGSARTVPAEVARDLLADAEAALAANSDPAQAEALAEAVRLAEAKVRTSRFYEETRELSRRLTHWSMAKPGRAYYVSTGGGPGIMEAGNRGAADVEGGRSVGLGISLPFEEEVNRYVPKDLAFEFHYFFMRKYWFMYLAKALVVMPGGFGTLDELAEIMTLVQTGKVSKPLPIVLYGKDYWDSILNLDAMMEWGTISPKDLKLFKRVDSVDEAFDYLTKSLVRIEDTGSFERG